MNEPTRRKFLKRGGKTLAAGAMIAGLPGPRRMGARGDDGRRPNILFFFPDQHRFDWIGGNPKIPVRTPNLDRVARRGVKFNKAVVASPLCAPSRGCLASGKEYDRARVASNGVDYPLDQTTFYSLLRASGYHVAGCGKFDLHKKSETWGLDGKHLLPEWGFSDGIDNAGKWDAIRSGMKEPKDPYMGFLERHGLRETHIKDFLRRRGDRKNYSVTDPTPLPEDAYCDNWIAQNGLTLLARAPKDRPWFLQVNFAGPHEPMDITRRMDEICRGRQFQQPNHCRELDPATHVAIRQNYSAMVENIDRWLGTFLEEIDRRGEMDNTLIVYSSDHGEMLGDQNRWAKSLPYHPSVSVPLVVSGPGVQRGVETDALVTNMDLAATYLDYAGVRRPDDMDSRSLRPVLEGKAKHHRRQVLSGLYGWRMVWDGRYKLITGFDPDSPRPQEAKNPQVLLFDLENDPLENVNLAASRPEQVSRLQGRRNG